MSGLANRAAASAARTLQPPLRDGTFHHDCGFLLVEGSNTSL
jgi:hypothetical protein